MEKQLEYFDVVANNQKQVLNNLVSAQNDLRTQWLDSAVKVKEAVSNIPGVPEITITKDALTQFNSWFDSVLSASKTAGDEVLKTQENWISAYEKQVAINREVFKNFIDVAKTAAPKKA